MCGFPCACCAPKLRRDDHFDGDTLHRCYKLRRRENDGTFHPWDWAKNHDPRGSVSGGIYVPYTPGTYQDRVRFQLDGRYGTGFRAASNFEGLANEDWETTVWYGGLLLRVTTNQFANGTNNNYQAWTYTPEGGHVREYVAYTTPSADLLLIIAWDGTTVDFQINDGATPIYTRTVATAANPAEPDHYAEFFFFGGITGQISRWDNLVEPFP